MTRTTAFGWLLTWILLAVAISFVSTHWTTIVIFVSLVVGTAIALVLWAWLKTRSEGRMLRERSINVARYREIKSRTRRKTTRATAIQEIANRTGIDSAIITRVAYGDISENEFTHLRLPPPRNGHLW